MATQQRPDAAQIRGALGLLRWENLDLAKACGVSAQTISNIKNDATRPHPRILATIKRVLELEGIEFLDESGVRFKPQGVEVLVGSAGLRNFFDDVYEYSRKHGGLIQQTGIDEAAFLKYLGDYSPFHIQRMTELVSKRGDIKLQALIREGDTNFFCSDYADYRWLSTDLFEPVPFYVYGDSLAVMSFQTIPAPTIVLHKIPAIANAYRKQFSVFWAMAKKPKYSKGNKE